MMNWSEYEEEQPSRKTVAPYWLVAVAIAFGVALAAALWSGKVYAEPLFAASTETATITLTDELCQLKAIGNLPYRATWVEKDKTYEGCWGARTDDGYVLAYFDDRTVALIPIQAFKKVNRA